MMKYSRTGLSQAIAYHMFQAPIGWSICGLLGYLQLVTPVLGPMIGWLDIMMGEPDHCYKAMMRSIERKRKE